ncbi:uncharacterized protein LOC127708172 isoform X1 [Mytilus californianus]|uniref:uncharacterized protein LOC127708172 isoform X1 n=1 Tax=Mytilus californianus TaxID=6549 RepID=UPI002246103B|nr:uncharacterized protein LOC127708172 isoform X1 [Mytilus californianus]
MNNSEYTCILHLILFLMTRDASTDSLIAHSEKTTWLESFKSCKEGFGGSAIFKHCQPSTCNTSNAIDKIANILTNKVEYWINGIVQRSPVVVYEGCYYIKTAAVNKTHRGQFNMSDNSVFSCSHKCPSLTPGSFIFMNNVECLCVPYKKYTTITRSSQLPVSNCKNVCPGNNEDFCGGERTSNFTLFSAYMIQAADKTNDQFKNDIGKTCGTTRNGNLVYNFCYKENKAVCADVNETDLNCTSCEYSWFDSQIACINEDKVLSSTIGTHACTTDGYWNGYHSAEVITWENFNKKSNPELCLRIEVWGTVYKLKAGNCTDKLQPICVLKDEASNTNDILYGSVGGILGLLVVFAIIVIVAILRHKSKIPKTSQKRPGYYSEPTVPTTSKETHSLVNVTEEGVYNHLGDTHEKFASKTSSPVYDVFGHADVEYDVSITNDRRQENIGNLYDSSRAVDVYDTTHDQEIKKRPESDTYNIVSTR